MLRLINLLLLFCVGSVATARVLDASVIAKDDLSANSVLVILDDHGTFVDMKIFKIDLISFDFIGVYLSNSDTGSPILVVVGLVTATDQDIVGRSPPSRFLHDFQRTNWRKKRTELVTRHKLFP